MIPRLGLRGDLSFMVDTGADETYLMPGDALVLGLDHSLLTATSRAVGVGGETVDFSEPAVLVFEDRRNLYVYGFDLTIADLNPHLLGVPSLLGRNILDHWNMRYRPPTRYLRFEVVTADVIEPLRSTPPQGRIAPPLRHE